MGFLLNILGAKSNLYIFLRKIAISSLLGNKSLPPLGANPDTVTMAGHSSGAMMSNQMHIIMSDTIKGVGLMQGASFWTIEYFLDRELADEVDVETVAQGSLDKAAEYLEEGLIDDTVNIEGAPVYILSGTLDTDAPDKF